MNKYVEVIVTYNRKKLLEEKHKSTFKSNF